jgi:glycosyltransferase involved in cell wall biosynthesis
MIRSANLTGSVSRNAGGLYESVRRLVQSLIPMGLEVQVFGTKDEHTAADIGAWAPVAVKAFRPIGSQKFGYSPQFLPTLKEFAPDLTHTHGLWGYPSVATKQYCRHRGVPYVISAHGMLDPWALGNSRWKKMIARSFYEDAHLQRAACLRALCESEARAIRRIGLKNPIAIIPNGIDVPEITPQDNESTRSQNASPWSLADGLQCDGRKVLLYLGRIHPKKGLANLLKAWAAFHSSPAARPSEWLLAIAGWDQCGHEMELKRLATELEIAWTDVREHPKLNQRSGVNGPCSVVFLGPQFQNAKAACYAHCDGFVLPSFSEGLPMVVLEAWAYGKPVLMTPECNLPCGFTREAAIRIETRPDDIARGLRKLFQLSDSDRALLGENGLRLVREQFAWPVVGREMVQLYEWLLGGGEKPACLADF